MTNVETLYTISRFYFRTAGQRLISALSHLRQHLTLPLTVLKFNCVKVICNSDVAMRDIKEPEAYLKVPDRRARLPRNMT